VRKSNKRIPLSIYYLYLEERGRHHQRVVHCPPMKQGESGSTNFLYILVSILQHVLIFISCYREAVFGISPLLLYLSYTVVNECVEYVSDSYESVNHADGSESVNVMPVCCCWHITFI
jgi:hypothetical protein